MRTFSICRKHSRSAICAHALQLCVRVQHFLTMLEGASAVYLHHLPQLLRQFGIDDEVVASQLQHCAASAVVLLLPVCLALLAHLALPIADMALQQAGVPLHILDT